MENNTMKQKILIIGFGRFGKCISDILLQYFDISIFDPYSESLNSNSLPDKYTVVTSEKDFFLFEYILYAIPISKIEGAVKDHSKYFSPNCCILDVCSVKVYPKNIYENVLGESVDFLLTHPMFGPDSVRANNNSCKNLNLVLCSDSKVSTERYTFWKDIFAKFEMNVLEMTSEEHDSLAANSQGVTHLLGRVLDEFNFQPTSIDTLGAKKLFELKTQVCNDTWELFTDLQQKNKYTKEMRIRMLDSFDKVFFKLLPKRIDEHKLIVGIQGGVGSFNEQAVMYYFSRNMIKNFEIKYLYTTKAVLEALNVGDIDCGQFAIHNSVGGIVGESIQAMSQYKFHIVEEFSIKIEHCLMKRKDVAVSEINVIMAHDQVFKQCRNTLANKYSKFELKTGENEFQDTARIARAVAEGEFENNIAVLGPKVLANIYDFDIIEGGLQDSESNYTNFLWVDREIV